MPAAIGVLRGLVTVGALAVLPATVGYAQGDGSFTDNPDLLRGSFSPFCEPAMLCHAADTTPPAPPMPVPGPLTLTDPPAAPVPAPAPPQPHPQASPLQAPPAYATGSPGVWRATYGVALRGSFIHSGGANRYEALVIPNLGLRYEGQGTRASLSGSARIVQPRGGDARVGAASLEGNYSHAVTSSSRLALDGIIWVSQEDPAGIDVTPSGAMTAPLQFRAEANAALTRQLGRLDLTASLGISRSQTGETVLAGGGTIDNSGTDRTRISGGMRLGYKLTPIFGVFASGNAGREEFDRISPDIGVSRSGWDYALRGGVSANWHDVTSLEASAGYGWRTYDAALPVTRSVLYGLAFGYNPDPTLRLRAAFDTEIAPGTGGAVASIDYTLSLEAAYKVNQWLGLRAEASASLSEAEGSGALKRRYGAGIGADIAMGPHSNFSFDYGYGWRSDPAATPEVATEHRVSAGVTLQY